MAKDNAILLALKPKGGPASGDEEGGDELSVDDDELEAAKAMRSAKTDEEYASALKAFIQLCMG